MGKRTSKYGAMNTVADLLPGSVWVGVGKTASGEVSVINTFEVVEDGVNKTRVTVKGANRTTKPLATSVLSDYRLKTPGTTSPVTAAPIGIPMRRISFIALRATDRPNITSTMRKSWFGMAGTTIHFNGYHIGHVTHVSVEPSTAGDTVRVDGLVSLPDGYTVEECTVDVVVHPAENRAELVDIQVLRVGNGTDVRTTFDFLPLPTLKADDGSTDPNPPAPVDPTAQPDPTPEYVVTYNAARTKMTRMLARHAGDVLVEYQIVVVNDVSTGHGLYPDDMLFIVKGTILPLPVVMDNVTIGNVVALTYDESSMPAIIVHVVFTNGVPDQATTLVKANVVQAHAGPVLNGLTVCKAEAPVVIKTAPAKLYASAKLTEAIGLNSDQEEQLALLVAELNVMLAHVGALVTPEQYVTGLIMKAAANARTRRRLNELASLFNTSVFGQHNRGGSQAQGNG